VTINTKRVDLLTLRTDTQMHAHTHTVGEGGRGGVIDGEDKMVLALLRAMGAAYDRREERKKRKRKLGSPFANHLPVFFSFFVLL
jgi:hypothetical protein